MDISSFFVSIDRDILYLLVKESLIGRGEEEKKELDWLLHTIVFHNPAKNFRTKGQLKLFSLIPDHKSLRRQKEKKGLPIGNHSSQFFANVYMNELDQFVKRRLGCRHYIRYVDDFILISDDLQKLNEWKREIEVFIAEKLALKLSHQKTIFQPIARGIDFLGYFTKPDSIFPRRQVFKRHKNKLFRIAIGECQTNLQYLQSMNNSYIGHFNFKGKFPAGVRNRFLTFTERAKIPASISAVQAI